MISNMRANPLWGGSNMGDQDRQQRRLLLRLVLLGIAIIGVWVAGEATRQANARADDNPLTPLTPVTNVVVDVVDDVLPTDRPTPIAPVAGVVRNVVDVVKPRPTKPRPAPTNKPKTPRPPTSKPKPTPSATPAPAPIPTLAPITAVTRSHPAVSQHRLHSPPDVISDFGLTLLLGDCPADPCPVPVLDTATPLVAAEPEPAGCPMVGSNARGRIGPPGDETTPPGRWPRITPGPA